MENFEKFKFIEERNKILKEMHLIEERQKYNSEHNIFGIETRKKHKKDMKAWISKSKKIIKSIFFEYLSNFVKEENYEGGEITFEQLCKLLILVFTFFTNEKYLKLEKIKIYKKDNYCLEERLYFLNKYVDDNEIIKEYTGIRLEIEKDTVFSFESKSLLTGSSLQFILNPTGFLDILAAKTIESIICYLNDCYFKSKIVSNVGDIICCRYKLDVNDGMIFLDIISAQLV